MVLVHQFVRQRPMEVSFENVRTSKTTLALALVQVPDTAAMYFEMLAGGGDHRSNCNEGSSMPMLNWLRIESLRSRDTGSAVHPSWASSAALA